MTVGRMLRELSSSELTEYIAFDRIDPIGEGRADLRAAITTSAVVNHSMSPPKNPTSPADFMPFIKRVSDEPIKLKDSAEHSKLIAQTLFGKKAD